MAGSAWILAGLAALLASSAQALTLDEAVTRALSAHPQLERWEARSRAAAADRDALALAPPLVISAQTENPFGAGLDAGEGTLQLSRVFERGGKAARRREAGEARLSRVGLEVTLQRTELMAETTRRFVSVVAAQAYAQLAAERVELASDLQERVERRVAAARTSRAEAHGARLEVARAQLEAARLDGELRASRARLAALWGDPTPTFARADADLFGLPAVPAVADALIGLAGNPDLLRLNAEQRLAVVEAERARAQGSADVTVSAAAKYFGELDAGGVALGFSVPLRARSRAAPALRAAEHDVLASELAVENRRRELEGLVAELIAQAGARKVQLQLLNDTIVPEALAAMRLYRRGYEAGRHPFFAVADAQRRWIDARRDAIDMAGRFHRLLIELERLTRHGGASR